MKQFYELLAGYSDPKTVFVGPAPIGKTGLTVRLRHIALLEGAFRSLGRRQCFGIGQRHFHLTYTILLESMRHLWQSEIMRVMDYATFGNGATRRENLTIRLFHEKFQAEPFISQCDKEKEHELYDLLMNRYEKDGYIAFRNKAGFHIDKEEALKEPKTGGNLHDMTRLILDWFKHAGTVVAGAEICFVTVGGPDSGRQMAREFKKMMIDTLKYRRLRHQSERAAA